MADYYRSGFEDDERRAPYNTMESGRSEGRYASGYAYGPTYGGTAGGYGTTTGGYGGYGAATGSFGGTTGAYGGTGGFGTTAGYAGYGPESTHGTSRFGSTQFGRQHETGFSGSIGTRHQGAGAGVGTIGTWRSEQTSERQYPDYTRTHAWTGQQSQQGGHQQTHFAEPGRAGIGQSVTRLQDFGAYGQGNPGPRRRFGNREYGPY